MTKLVLNLYGLVGSFAENKDIAEKIRVSEIFPALDKGEKIIIDFDGVESATQSFIHALISDIIRKKGSASLDSIRFKNCNSNIRKIIQIVSEYMQY